MPTEPVRIDDFAAYRYVNSVRVTPDAKRLVYSVISVDLQENRYDNDLWTLDLSSGDRRRLTGSGKEGRFDFMDDGSVLFVSRRGGQAADSKAGKAGNPATSNAAQDGARPSQAQVVALATERSAGELAGDPSRGTDLYRIALDGGEAELYAHIPLTVADWRQLPGGRLLVRGRELSDSAAPYAALEDIPFWENGNTYTAGLRWGLYVADPAVEPGAKPGAVALRRLTAADESVDLYALSSDRTRVYLASRAYRGKMPLTNRMGAVDLATGERTAMGPDDMAFKVLELLDDDTLMLLGTDMRTYGINEDPQVFLMGTDGSGYHCVSPEDFNIDLYNHIVSDARQGGGQAELAVGGALFVAHADGDASHLSRLTAAGEKTLLIGGEGSLDCFDTLDGRTFYYVAMRPNLLPEIYRRTVDADGCAAEPETRLTDFSSALEGATFVAPESFEFESNGATLTGYVVKPAGYVPGERHPGVLWVHGGPKCVMGNVLSHEIQWLSNLGYFVFYTNPHGSGGHGIEYAASIFGGYGGMDFDDLMAFTDEVLERYPDVDGGRLAEMGGSYGGFMTNWVIGHTDRFACCVSQRSISNWVSMFGVADIGYYFADDQTRGWPWGETDGVPNVAAMWDQSPLKYADQVKTPTLFLHSDADYRCPLEQGMQMFTALQLHGVPTRLTVFKGENHELSRSGKPQARVRRLAEIADWCARWLKGEEGGEPTLHEGAPAAGASCGDGE